MAFNFKLPAVFSGKQNPADQTISVPTRMGAGRPTGGAAGSAPILAFLSQYSVTKQLQILQEKIDSIGSKVSTKIMSRQEIISAVSRPTLSTYERVRKGRGGRVVVLVRKRACSACFKALTPKKVQEIKRGDQIITCDNCGCLLYWDEGESN